MMQSEFERRDSLTAAPSISDHIGQNIESLMALQRREWEQTSVSRRRVERISRFVGRPAYFVGVLALVLVWLGINLIAKSLGIGPFDPPPFSILHPLPPSSLITKKPLNFSAMES